MLIRNGKIDGGADPRREGVVLIAEALGRVGADRLGDVGEALALQALRKPARNSPRDARPFVDHRV